VNEAGQELNLSTADHPNVGFHPWLNIQSARWLRFGSAPTLPAGQVVEAIPQSVTFRQGQLSYTAQYVLSGRKLTAKRTFIADRKQPVCQPKDEEDWAAFRKVLLRDLRGQVVLR
jgi:hypothetical protein